jgi:hypothetical protein
MPHHIIWQRVGVIYLRQLFHRYKSQIYDLIHKYKSEIYDQYIILKEFQRRIRWHMLLSMNIPHFCTIIG